MDSVLVSRAKMGKLDAKKDLQLGFDCAENVQRELDLMMISVIFGHYETASEILKSKEYSISKPKKFKHYAYYIRIHYLQGAHFWIGLIPTFSSMLGPLLICESEKLRNEMITHPTANLMNFHSVIYDAIDAIRPEELVHLKGLNEKTAHMCKTWLLKHENLKWAGIFRLQKNRTLMQQWKPKRVTRTQESKTMKYLSELIQKIDYDVIHDLHEYIIKELFGIEEDDPLNDELKDVTTEEMLSHDVVGNKNIPVDLTRLEVRENKTKALLKERDKAVYTTDLYPNWQNMLHQAVIGDDVL